MFGIFGNLGAYRMPHTKTYATRDEALEYARQWWPDNRFVVVRPVMTPVAPYTHTGFEAGAL